MILINYTRLINGLCNKYFINIFENITISINTKLTTL